MFFSTVCTSQSSRGDFSPWQHLIMEPARKLCLLSSHMCLGQLLKHAHALTKGGLCFIHSGDCRKTFRILIPKREYKEHLI